MPEPGRAIVRERRETVERGASRWPERDLEILLHDGAQRDLREAVARRGEERLPLLLRRFGVLRENIDDVPELIDAREVEPGGGHGRFVRGSRLCDRAGSARRDECQDKRGASRSAAERPGVHSARPS